jgi:predicted N-formylglutamate amidohydrolase
VTPKDLASAEPPFEFVAPGAGSDVLLLCDHASNRVPPCIAGGSLGLGTDEMARHIAYDIGARGVTTGLAKRMEATAILSRFSRLVIDPNRGEDDPTLVMRLYDGTIVPANRRIAPEEVERRLAAFHRPYHVAIAGEIDRRMAAGRPPALVAIHSFTPKLIAGRPRPWHVGVLWHRDRRVAQPLIERLRREAGLCVGENQPYAGQLEGDTLSRHGTRRGLPHVLIELRHDLIDTEPGQAAWAERLAPILQEVAGGALQEGET